MPRLLIVEDDIDLAEMMASFFSLRGYEVDTAAWASEAIELTAQRSYQLIILDIRLPDIDGFTLCRKLREQGRTKETPILFLTERSARSDRLQGLELGVVDYITKPFDLQLMGLRVRNILQRVSGVETLHSVTDLPGPQVVDEKLAELLASDQPWAILTFAIVGLGEFRERVGFMAADDTLRALALIVRNAISDVHSDEVFIGHANDATLIVITEPTIAQTLYNTISRRIDVSRAFEAAAQDHSGQVRPRLMSGIYQRPTELPPDVASLKKAIVRATSA
ncbi:response regulator [Aggregatilineales bacterium SYSU G02658]